MNRLEAEAIVRERRRDKHGRNFEKDHSMDECVARLMRSSDNEDKVTTDERARTKRRERHQPGAGS
jgi:hypothetical protein